MAFASVLSIGDFGVVALFGNEHFRTLPFYLYQPERLLLDFRLLQIIQFLLHQESCVILFKLLLQMP